MRTTGITKLVGAASLLAAVIVVGLPTATAAAHHRRVKAHASSVTCVSSGLNTQWSSSCWRPYSSTSPFNEPIPATPSLAPTSAAFVQSLVGTGNPGNFQAGPTVGRQAVYYTNTSAPSYTVHCTEAWGTCAVEGAQLHIPASALPAPNSDHHMVVIDAAARMEYDFWQTGSLPPTGGTLDISWGGKTSIDGLGLGSNSTAAKFGGLAGMVRASELTAGHIDHALVLSVKCDNGTFVWPAAKSDFRCADGSGPAMGARFQLNMTATQINALAIPAWNKTVLRAFATYGAYVEDTGNDPWAIQFEAGQTYTSFGLPNPWVTVAKGNSWPYWAPDNDYVGHMSTSIPWSQQLRVISPCVAQLTC